MLLCNRAYRPVLGPAKFHVEWILWVKLPWYKADHSSEFSTEVKNDRTYISAPPYAFLTATPTRDSVGNVMKTVSEP